MWTGPSPAVDNRTVTKRTNLTRAEVEYLRKHLPPERFISPEVGRVDRPYGDPFVWLQEVGMALIDGRAFACRFLDIETVEDPVLFVEFRHRSPVAEFTAESTYPVLEALREVPS